MTNLGLIFLTFKIYEIILYDATLNPEGFYTQF